jgi:signal transduction histidine kinase
VTDSGPTTSAPSADAPPATGPFHAEGARERMLWPATAGVLLTLLLAWATLVLVPAPWQRWAAGLAVVAGVLATAIACGRAAVRWVDDDGRATAALLTTRLRWLAPGRVDPAHLPPPLRAAIEQAMRIAVAQARSHADTHADAEQAALGGNVAARLDGIAAALGASIAAHDAAPDDAARATALVATRRAHGELAALSTALRRAAMPAATPDAVHDGAALAQRVAADVRAALGDGALLVREDGARAPVRVHAPSFAQALAAVLRAAATDSAPSAAAMHVRRVRRAAYEDEPVRRADDSPRTIVPRMPQSVVRQWVAATQPPAEVLNVVVADASRAVGPAERERALDPFAVARPADPMGLALAELRRVVERANGCIWLDDAREGGTAVHLLLPIAIEE